MNIPEDTQPEFYYFDDKYDDDNNFLLKSIVYFISIICAIMIIFVDIEIIYYLYEENMEIKQQYLDVIKSFIVFLIFLIPFDIYLISYITKKSIYELLCKKNLS